MSQNIDGYGITNTGFHPKPIDVLEEDAKEYLQQLFGSNVDLTQQSPLWRLTQVQLVEVSKGWLVSEANFYNNYIQTAEGVGLELLGEDLGLEIKEAVASVVELTIYKNSSASVTVPIGSLFQTLNGIIFATDIEITIPSGDPSTTTGLVMATCVVAGLNGNVSASTIIIPSNPITGVDSSTNLNTSYGGKDRETYTEYRKRLRSYVRSTWTASAIRSAALNVDGVSGVKIIEYTTSYDCLIAPQTSFTPELQTLIEIAIEKVTPVTVEYNVIESESVGIKIYANIILTTLLDIETARTLISTEISEYIASLGIDGDVYKSKIIQAILAVEGVLNIYNVELYGVPINEKHTYTTGTLSYALNYATGNGIDSIVGKLSGVDHTFVDSVDYNFSTSPATITWTGTGDLPDDLTEFKVTYQFPANAIGDIEIRQENIAVFSRIDLT